MNMATLAAIFDGIGVLVGAFAILFAVYTLYHYPDDYDQPYIIALYLVGLLLLFFAGERPLDHTLTTTEVPVVFGRFLMYLGVGYWEYVLVREKFLKESTARDA